MTDFTELPVPAKQRLIIQVHFTGNLDPMYCELCRRARVPGPGETHLAPMCDVCGRMLCNACYGDVETVPGPGDRQYNICDDCVCLEEVAINAVLELRARLGGTR